MIAIAAKSSTNPLVAAKLRIRRTRSRAFALLPAAAAMVRRPLEPQLTTNVREALWVDHSARSRVLPVAVLNQIEISNAGGAAMTDAQRPPPITTTGPGNIADR